MKAHLQYSILFGAMFIWPQCKSQPAMVSEIAAAINAHIERQVEKGFSGSVLVSENNNVLFSRAYGLANREREIPNNENTRFEIASITKLFTAVAILQLAEQGQLSLGDQLSNI